MIEWMKGCPIDWLIDCSIDCLIDWLIDWLVDWLIGWLVDYLQSLAIISKSCLPVGRVNDSLIIGKQAEQIMPKSHVILYTIGNVYGKAGQYKVGRRNAIALNCCWGVDYLRESARWLLIFVCNLCSRFQYFIRKLNRFTLPFHRMLRSITFVLWS